MAAAVTSCGSGIDVGVDALDVQLVKTSECSLTGQATRNCIDVAVLAQTTLTARWIVQSSDDRSSISITREDGDTMAGLAFQNDGVTLNTAGCSGEGGRCLFVRRRSNSSDVNTGCVRFEEVFAVGHFLPDDPRHFVGNLNAVAGSNEACGQAITTEVITTIDGTLAEQPVLALQEAQ